MMISTFVSVVVGLMEVGPNVCQVDLYNPDKTIHTFKTKCEYIVTTDRVTIPHRAPYGP